MMHRFIFIQIILFFMPFLAYAEKQKEFYEIYLGYNMSNIDSNSETDHGFHIGFTKSIHFPVNFPLFVEWGGEYQYESHWEVDWEERLSSFSVPLNFALYIPIGQNSHLVPFVGTTARWNFLGKWEYTGFDYDVNLTDVDYFDDMDARHIQFGFDFGSRLQFKHWFLVWKYCKDTSDYFKGIDSKVKRNYVSIGFVW